MRIIRSVAVLIVGLSAFASLLLQAQPKPNPRAVSKLFGELCASCHGPNLTGAQAQSLLDDVWKFGGDDASLTRSIKEGNLAAGMPPMANALSDQEVRAMVIYIREEAAKFKRGQSTFAKPAVDAVVKSELHTFKLETVVSGLGVVWGIDFLPDGRMLLTEKTGQLRVVEKRQAAARTRRGRACRVGQGAGRSARRRRAPDYATNGWIYLSYSDPAPDGSAMTAIVRGKLQDGQFVEQQTIYKAPAALYRTGGNHFGSRLVFDKGYLFFSIGERGHAGRRAGRLAAQRQGSPDLRRRARAGGQPVCRQGRGSGDDLELRPPQPAGTGHGSVQRRCCTTPSTDRAAATN